MDGLAEWLLEQIAEDEAEARDPEWWDARRAKRVLVECEAKRRILAEVVPEIDAMDDRIEGEWGLGGSGPHDESRLLLKLIALPYADRPGYLPEWRPE